MTLSHEGRMPWLVRVWVTAWRSDMWGKMLRCAWHNTSIFVPWHIHVWHVNELIRSHHKLHHAHRCMLPDVSPRHAVTHTWTNQVIISTYECYEWYIWYIYIYNKIYIHVTFERRDKPSHHFIHMTHMNVSRHKYGCVMSRTSLHLCPIYRCVTQWPTHVQVMASFPHVKESWHKYICVMSCTSLHIATHITASHHTYEWVMESKNSSVSHKWSTLVFD